MATIRHPGRRAPTRNAQPGQSPERQKDADERKLREERLLDVATTLLVRWGYRKTTIDDVAREAGVGKGTIYLHFEDKENLFQELVRARMVPVVGTLEAAFRTDLPLRLVVERAVDIFVRDIYETPRKQVMRLIISEGPRFPAIAEFYYREVLGRLLKALRAYLRRAFERGELADDTLIRFPQLIGAPGVIAVVWSDLFERFEPLDVRAMMRAHFQRLLAGGSPS